MERCPEIHYRKETDGIGITGFYGPGGEIRIPDQIAGMPVKKVGAYACSVYDEEEGPDTFADCAKGVVQGSYERLETTGVAAVYLPRYVEEIGRYVFYRCFRMEKLALSDSLKEIGAGAFTGCRLREVEIDLYKGEQSCLKTIVDEQRFALYVTMNYHGQDGSVETAKLVFPEHYEEAVENTPARILETRRHGSGGDYRQCFYNREVNYGDYDELLPRAVAQDDQEVVTDLVCARLCYPYRLSSQGKERYETYLRRHISYAGCLFVGREDMRMLRFFSRERYWTPEGMGQAIDLAAELKKTAVLSYLMDEQHRIFPKKKKGFQL